jgi:hypothetical protein
VEEAKTAQTAHTAEAAQAAAVAADLMQMLLEVGQKEAEAHEARRRHAHAKTSWESMSRSAVGADRRHRAAAAAERAKAQATGGGEGGGGRASETKVHSPHEAEGCCIVECEFAAPTTTAENRRRGHDGTSAGEATPGGCQRCSVTSASDFPRAFWSESCWTCLHGQGAAAATFAYDAAAAARATEGQGGPSRRAVGSRCHELADVTTSATLSIHLCMRVREG